MTPEERALIFSLVLVPGRPYKGNRDAILQHFGTQNGRALGLRLLRDAIDVKNAEDVEAYVFSLDDRRVAVARG